MRIAAGVVILLFGFAFYLGLFGDSGPKATVVRWDTLKKLDYRSGQVPKELEALDGKTVRVPGFIVPLEDELHVVSEFLLVPAEGSCIHVPPPPPNQMIYVRMRKARPVILIGVPFWITGVLRIAKVDSPYGSVAYTLEGLKAAGFRSWDDAGD